MINIKKTPLRLGKTLSHTAPKPSIPTRMKSPGPKPKDDVDKFVADHFTERFAHLKQELDSADETPADRLANRPGNVSIEEQGTTMLRTGELESMVIRSATLTSSKDRVVLTNKTTNPNTLTSKTEEFHLNQITGVLTVLQGPSNLLGGDTSESSGVNKRVIDTRNGSLIDQEPKSQSSFFGLAALRNRNIASKNLLENLADKLKNPD